MCGQNSTILESIF